MYTNSQIIAAVVNKWAQPIITQFATMLSQDQISQIPFVGNVESMAKHFGLVSPNYSLLDEIPGLINPLSSELLLPNIHKQLVLMADDEYLPQMIHGIVDKFIEQEGVTIFERFNIDTADFKLLKKMLNFNVPLTEKNGGYVVKMQ